MHYIPKIFIMSQLEVIVIHTGSDTSVTSLCFAGDSISFFGMLPYSMVITYVYAKNSVLRADPGFLNDVQKFNLKLKL